MVSNRNTADSNDLAVPMPLAPLSKGARTVVQMADYFEELKQSAGALGLEMDYQERGYFSPTEEEQTHGLLVSYWQTRAALHELISEMLAEDVFVDPTVESPTPETDCRFQIAFAAALLLVDAAKFLRSLAAGRPIVRKKLNQPVAEFGLEGGSYDAVQKSLFSARKGWRLLQARYYYAQHRKRLVESAQQVLNRAIRDQAAHVDPHADDYSAAQLIAVLDEYAAHLDVSWARFVFVKLRTMFDRVARRMGRQVYRHTVYGLQQFGSEIVADVYVRPGHSPEIDEAARATVVQRIRPGDVMMVRKEHALTNYFLPGYWPHAALYLGSAETLRQRLASHPGYDELNALLDAKALSGPLVLEAMKDGVHVRSIGSPFSSDSIVVLRPTLDEEQLTKGLARALAHAGKAYDFDFDFGRSDRMVCTEVVYRAFDGLGPIQFALRQRAGRPTLSGADLVKMARLRDGFLPVVAFDGDSQPINDLAIDDLIDGKQG